MFVKVLKNTTSIDDALAALDQLTEYQKNHSESVNLEVEFTVWEPPTEDRQVAADAVTEG